jgi:hypothetical protein
VMKENLCEEETPIAQYAFVDYKCDFCDMQPILNIRFHCKSCEDYDLCEKCYEDCDSIHEHQSFEKIDGRLLKEKALERLFQAKDQNLKANVCHDTLKSTVFPTSIIKLTSTKTFHFKS